MSEFASSGSSDTNVNTDALLALVHRAACSTDGQCDPLHRLLADIVKADAPLEVSPPVARVESAVLVRGEVSLGDAVLHVSGQWAPDVFPCVPSHEAITFDVHRADRTLECRNMAADQVAVLRDVLTRWLDAVAAEQAEVVPVARVEDAGSRPLVATVDDEGPVSRVRGYAKRSEGRSGLPGQVDEP